MLEAAGYEPGANGGALAQVSQHLKVPHNTLRNWYVQKHNPAPSELRLQKGFDLSEMLQNEIVAALGEMEKTRPDAMYKELGTVVGIFMDKLANLHGQPTNRVEIAVKYADTNFNTSETTSGTD